MERLVLHRLSKSVYSTLLATKRLKYRARNEIIGQILDCARETQGVTKTKIMFHAFLSYGQLREYLSLLVENGLLEHDARKNTYKTTNKGIKILEAYQKMSALVGVPNDQP
jgi:predicted transcriptional regulator